MDRFRLLEKDIQDRNKGSQGNQGKYSSKYVEQDIENCIPFIGICIA